jgi:hypothetical protein
MKGFEMDAHSFSDYYEILQISPNADFETIERVYRLLAKKYHPDNKSTGHIEKFEILIGAYKILSDPEKRASYDATYQEGKNHQWKQISKAFSSEGFEMDQHIRKTILSILYTKRRQNPSQAGIGIVQLENVMKWPGETLDFHVWYLREKNLIARTDDGMFEITAEGVDKIESDGLIIKDKLLTESGGTSEKLLLIEPGNST